MSLIGKIVGAAEAVGSLPQRAWDFAQRVWHEVQVAWAFIVHISGILTNAWTWVLNGVGFLADQVGGWASEVFGTLWQTLTSTIPKAIAWVFNQAVHWAARAIHDAVGFLRKIIDDIYRFLVHLIHTLYNALKAALHQLIKWVTNPIRWVLLWGAWLIHLLTHPENIARWIAGAILEPVAEWFLHAGANVIVWALRKIEHETTQIAHLIEDALAKVL